MNAAEAFIRRHTGLERPPLVPELRFWLATEVTPIWQSSEAYFDEIGIDPPYWAFCWPGGQALARLVLDRPELVRGRRVLDVAAGCGVAGFAAVRAGAAAVTENDIDRLALEALRLNAAENGVSVAISGENLVGGAASGWDVVLAGDVCYQYAMAGAIVPWLRALAAAGTTVLLADPGRAYVPVDRLERLAEYGVPTPRALEDRDLRETTVWRVLP